MLLFFCLLRSSSTFYHDLSFLCSYFSIFFVILDHLLFFSSFLLSSSFLFFYSVSLSVFISLPCNLFTFHHYPSFFPLSAASVFFLLLLMLYYASRCIFCIALLLVYSSFLSFVIGSSSPFLSSHFFFYSLFSFTLDILSPLLLFIYHSSVCRYLLHSIIVCLPFCLSHSLLHHLLVIVSSLFFLFFFLSLLPSFS